MRPFCFCATVCGDGRDWRGTDKIWRMNLEERVENPTTVVEAAQIARSLYGVEATVTALPGEYDDNFCLQSADRRVFVLKVMHPARERSFIDLQCKALQHLERQSPQLCMPRVVLAQSGELFSEIAAGDGAKRIVWMLTYVHGTVMAKAKPHEAELLRGLGKFLGEMDAALADFSHEAARRELKWDSARAGWIKEYVGLIAEPDQRVLVEKFLGMYEREVVPALPRLRRSVIYGDANDYNVLVGEAAEQPRKIASVIDFGDMHEGVTVSEAAIAAAYAILGKKKKEALRAATELVGGYHSAFELEEKELSVMYALIGMRLAVSVVNSAQRAKVKPGDAYVTVSEAPAWEALEKWAGIHPKFAECVFRTACGYAADERSERVKSWLRKNAANVASVLDVDLRTAACTVFDLSVGSTFLGADPRAAELGALTEKIFGEMKRRAAAVGVGRYDEARLLYGSPLFGASENPTAERRTIHLGMDLFVEAGARVYAPFDGTVEAIANNKAALDYGPVVILKHQTGEAGEFYTLYGHLTTETLRELKPGQKITQRHPFARVGDTYENGGWVPHLHFQIIWDLMERGTDFPGVCAASEREVWTGLSPDPNLILQIPESKFPAKEVQAEETAAARKKLLGQNLSVSYAQPLKIVRGWKQYLYDGTGRAYLDVYNNVPLVGHSHPRVVKAAQEQLGLLNTNTRYLHDNVNRYAERLVQKMPEPLRVCYFLNSGSEANELALRLARAHTGREDMIVLEHAYHGHTSSLIDMSPYKFEGPGGRGKKEWVHVAALADAYRGIYRRKKKAGEINAETQRSQREEDQDQEIGKKYAGHMAEILERVKKEGRGVAGFIAETLPSVGGQIVFPAGYLSEVYKLVRAAGGVCIADEVQVGFGRLGTHFWGFETQEVIPDIVVLGKPIGNAFPLAAVVTTREIAESFANGMEFFSTFGGNPVSCAAGLAVLDVLEEEKLQENALKVGGRLMEMLNGLKAKHAVIGDVRGAGLFLGVDLVKDRESRTPAARQASYVVNRLREEGILAGTDGPHHNVIKLRPPLVFSEKDAALFVATLDEVLGEDAAQADA
jgi:4-aminobutyrate aminotransferase-like enzyme/Ser/Thr protein kinase RdoA (MazF antagonist)